MLPTPADVLKTMMKYIDPTVDLQDDALVLFTDVPLQCTQNHPMAACIPFEYDDFHNNFISLQKMFAQPDFDDAYYADDSDEEPRNDATDVSVPLPDNDEPYACITSSDKENLLEPQRRKRKFDDCISPVAENAV
jgi:hypothetical protein